MPLAVLDKDSGLREEHIPLIRDVLAALIPILEKREGQKQGRPLGKRKTLYQCPHCRSLFSSNQVAKHVPRCPELADRPQTTLERDYGVTRVTISELGMLGKLGLKELARVDPTTPSK